MDSLVGWAQPTKISDTQSCNGGHSPPYPTNKSRKRWTVNNKAAFFSMFKNDVPHCFYLLTEAYHDAITIDKALSGKSCYASRIFLLPATSHEPHPVPIILHELKPHEHDPVALPPPLGVEHRAFDRVLFCVHASRHDPFE